jgi:hypothetical protein
MDFLLLANSYWLKVAICRFANANLRDRRVAEVRILEPDSRGLQKFWGIRFFISGII